MQTITLFKAFDGSTFDNGFDCLRYESVLRHDITKDVLSLYDSEWNELELTPSAYSNADHMHIGNVTGAEYVQNGIFSYDGIVSDNLKNIQPGCYDWEDNNKGDWVDVDEALRQAQKRKDNFYKYALEF